MIRRNDPASTSWVFKQIDGVARALKVLHDLSIRHGDIKPDNLLIFSNPTSEQEDEDKRCKPRSDSVFSDERLAVEELKECVVLADVGLARKHT